MSTPPVDDRSVPLLHAAWRVSAVSMAWTLLTSTAAVVIGIGVGSLVLVAFGLTGLLDAAGSATLVVHFRHALKHEAFSEAHERFAHRVVATGLVVVGLATAAESVHRLVSGATSETTAAGIGLAGASAVVLVALSHRKRSVGRAIPSAALVADGWLSLTGALLAVVTLVGIAVGATLDWSWVDPAAALVVGLGAVAVGLRSGR